jgi:hypothetical protein
MKKRILIPIVGQGSIAHIIRSGIVKGMRSFCEPIIILRWKQDDLIEELRADGIEVHIMPEYLISDTYKNLRTKITFWYQNFSLKTPSTNIQKRYYYSFKSGKFVLKHQIKEGLLWLRLTLDKAYIKRLIAAESQMIREEKAYSTYASWINTLNADGIFTVTPFLQEVELVARLLKPNNAQLISSIHSFDNVTKRGWPAIFFDQYFVWNKYNKAELERINPALKQQDAISIAGAPQFDFHYNPAFCWDKTEWEKTLGLPHGKKIILYAGGTSNLFPNEPQYVKQLVGAVESGEMPSNTVILFRCHPLDDVKRWKEYIGESPFLFYDFKPPVDRKLDHNNITDENLARLISTLKHTDVHINVCSTMAVDGSVFNKPQIAPYYDEVNKHSENRLRAVYKQEHYLPIIKSGVLHFAESKQQLVDKVAKALDNPDAYNTNCQRCVEEIITYRDGQSASRVIALLKNIIAP